MEITGAKLQFHPETFLSDTNTATGIPRIKCNKKKT